MSLEGLSNTATTTRYLVRCPLDKTVAALKKVVLAYQCRYNKSVYTQTKIKDSELISVNNVYMLLSECGFISTCILFGIFYKKQKYLFE